MTYEEKAKAIGCAKSALTRWKNQGCNVDGTVEEIKEWRASYLDSRGRKARELSEISHIEVPELTFKPSEGETFEDALARLKKRERDLDGEIVAIQDYLRETPNPKLRSRLPGLRKEHRDTVKDITAVHKTLVLMNSGNELQEALNAAGKFAFIVLDSVFYWLHTLPGKVPGACKQGGLYPELSDGVARALVEKAVNNIFDNVGNLIPNALAQSGMTELQQRATDIVEAAKAKALSQAK